MKKALLITIPLLASVVIGIIFANAGLEPLAPGTIADSIQVEKSSRQLKIFKSGRLIRSYPIALGRSPIGAKTREGDNKTPEGSYIIDWRNPSSGYHLSLHVSYPSPADMTRARQAGIQPGGAIMIHGLRNGLGWLGRAHRPFNWTRGCIAVTNPEIEELWRVIPNGTPILIKP